MASLPKRKRPSSDIAMSHLLLSAIAVSILVQQTDAKYQHVFRDGWQGDFIRLSKAATVAKRGPPEDWDGRIPLRITNKCESTMWPGIVTQSGTGPGTGGFEQASGNTTELWVSPDWQGRIWGRTNCTVSDDSCKCETGDCFGELDCESSVSDWQVPPQFPSRLTGNRARRRQHWLNSHLQAAKVAHRPSTTSHSSMDTTFPWLSTTSPPRTPPLFRRT